LLQLLPLRGGLWDPTIDDRVAAGDLPGVVLASKAAHDLGVEAGDIVTLRHPQRSGPTSSRFIRSKVQVLGISPLPTRFVAFIDRSDATLFGLDGITNTIVVEPERGVSTRRVERTLFSVPGVGSVQPVAEYTTSIRKEIDRVLGILTVVEAAVLLLALLIAFNSASISADERARDHATMFAFGVPTRTVLRMNVVESAVIGVLGTALGVAAGWLLLRWLVEGLLPETFPDLAISTSLATSTVVIAVVLGIVAVAGAPLLTTRRLRRMDVPSTLRVME
jgi:putative ABC transport system permease protein